MPNVLFMDGFDAYNMTKVDTSAPSIHSKWVTIDGRNLDSAAGRYGGQALRMEGSSTQTGVRGFFKGNPFIQSGTFSFAIKSNTVWEAGGADKFFAPLHNLTPQFALSFTNIGQICMWRGDVKVAESVPNLLKINDWHFLELEYVGHTSSGRASLYWDGTKVLEFTGNTQAAGSYGFNGFQLRCGYPVHLDIDDLFVIDEASRIGERRIETLRPNADLPGNQWIPNNGSTSFPLLNDTLVNEASYVSADVLGRKDMYEFSNLNTIPSQIDAVQLNVWATKTDADTRQIATILKSGSAPEVVSQNYNLPTNHLCVHDIFQKNPDGDVAWTPAAVNALQAGFKVTL